MTLINKLPAAAKALARATAPIPHRALISVTGPEATRWLNGILSSTVPNPPRGHFYSAFLNAQGRILHDLFVYARPHSQGYLIEHDSRSVSDGTIPALLPALRQFVLRAKVKLRDVSEEYDVWAAWGSEHELHWETPRRWSRADRSNIAEPLWDASHETASPWGTQDLVLRDRRAVGMGHRLLVKRGERPQEAASHDVGSPHDYVLHRYSNGVPEGALELQQGHAFPMESNMDIMGAIDFRKGCYIGQELTVRTYHTGVTRKRIFPVSIHPMHQTPAEDATTGISDPAIRLVVQESSDGTSSRKPRGTNKLLGSVNGVGLALLRLDHVEAADRGSVQFAMGEEEKECRVMHWYPTWWPTPHSIITHVA